MGECTPPGLPRLADGKPDLNAPTPRAADGKPDLSGVWRASTATSRFLLNLGAGQGELPLRPEARELYKRRLAAEGAGGRPSGVCRTVCPWT